MEHEFGYLPGLVNMGTPMQIDHEDAGHINHCNNSGWLMSNAFGSTDSLKYLRNPIWILDVNCKAGLTANGVK